VSDPGRKTYGVRTRNGLLEIVWLETVRNGFWRGLRLPDGVRTRGPVSALDGRFASWEEARAFIRSGGEA
jgi:hypothetical protein